MYLKTDLNENDGPDFATTTTPSDDTLILKLDDTFRVVTRPNSLKHAFGVAARLFGLTTTVPPHCFNLAVKRHDSWDSLDSEAAYSAVKPDSVLRIERSNRMNPYGEKDFQISLRTMDAGEHVLRVFPSTLVENLKIKVQKVEPKFAPETQRLIFMGKELQNGKKLSDYKVRPDFPVQLVKRCHSG